MIEKKCVDFKRIETHPADIILKVRAKYNLILLEILKKHDQHFHVYDKNQQYRVLHI